MPVLKKNIDLEQPNTGRTDNTVSDIIRAPSRFSSSLFPANEVSSLSYNVPLPKSSSTDTKAPLFIELCCGSARLSFELKARGLKVLPIDWANNKQKCAMSFLKLDLLDRKQIDIVLDLVDKGAITVAWAAVPCGTSSKAREIPLSSNVHGPRQLRSDQFPEGLPHLTASEAERVRKANLIYDHVALILERVLSKGGLIAVESS